MNFAQPILVAIFVSAAASLFGAFAILKRMALVGDALSHVALPGLALALIFHFNPFVGALVFLVAAMVGVWLVEHKSKLPAETVIGVFFTASLALGAVIAPKEELLEAIFGNIYSLSPTESFFSIGLSIILIILTFLIRKKLALNMISSELAQSIGIKNKRLDLIYLLIFALIVALGIRFVGALLMGSLVIIPAAAAKNFSRNFNAFLVNSMTLGIISAVAGVYISQIYHQEPGPIFVLVGGAFFALSLLLRLAK